MSNSQESIQSTQVIYDQVLVDSNRESTAQRPLQSDGEEVLFTDTLTINSLFGQDTGDLTRVALSIHPDASEDKAMAFQRRISKLIQFSDENTKKKKLVSDFKRLIEEFKDIVNVRFLKKIDKQLYPLTVDDGLCGWRVILQSKKRLETNKKYVPTDFHLAQKSARNNFLSEVKEIAGFTQDSTIVETVERMAVSVNSKYSGVPGKGPKSKVKVYFPSDEGLWLDSEDFHKFRIPHRNGNSLQMSLFVNVQQDGRIVDDPFYDREDFRDWAYLYNRTSPVSVESGNPVHFPSMHSINDVHDCISRPCYIVHSSNHFFPLSRSTSSKSECNSLEECLFDLLQKLAVSLCVCFGPTINSRPAQ